MSFLIAESIANSSGLGSQLTVGVCGYEEILIDTPLTPKEIHNIIYTRVQPHDIYQAVLQQEIMLYFGKLIATHRSVFNGILKIRIGYLLCYLLYQWFPNCELQRTHGCFVDITKNDLINGTIRYFFWTRAIVTKITETQRGP